MRKALLLLLALVTFSVTGFSQIVADPATWTYEVKEKGGNQYEVLFKLKLKPKWHIWSLEPGGDGLQVPPSFTFEKVAGVKTVGTIQESGKKHSEEMDGVDGIVNFFENSITYTQKIEATTTPVTLTGTHRYQVCDDKMCLAPKNKKFSIKVAGKEEQLKKKSDTVSSVLPTGDTQTTVYTLDNDTANTDTAVSGGNNNTKTPLTAGTAPVLPAGGGTEEEKESLWLVFFAAFGSGLLAIMTPCIFSMIPITVSFFTKRSKNRKEGIRNAFLYATSIIIIFTLLGVLISAIFGANALNNLSTNWIANLIFFVLFVVFGISFLGAFEITLPSSWTSVTDSRANTKSFSGIFFMALTLVIVSFSCTGPVVGPLLVLASKGGVLGPTIGMGGFSLGLALPFAIFAVFPGLLNKIAASGGWLNQVKVFLGFIELMLALKFLSNADLSQGWRLLDREVFLSIWIVLSVMIGLYLLGKLKLSHDDASAKNVYGQDYVGLPKLFIAIASFAFAVYMVPGLWGAPLKGLSNFLPQMGTQDFSLGGNENTFTGGSIMRPEGTTNGIKPVKLVEEFRIYEPDVVKKYGLVTYYDYEEALAAGKEMGKPVMLDFTGINCANCRKMESAVWSDAQVMKMLKEDFVVASLYCDFDKVELPKSEQRFSKILNADIVTIGDANEAIQAEQFGANSQPFYFFVDAAGNRLAEKGYGYDPSVSKFIAHLEGVKAKYKELHK